MAASASGLSDIELDIAPSSGPAASVPSMAWEYAGARRTSADLVITAGRDDEAARVEAGSLSALMEDRNGDLSPRNVLGKWYGTLTRGTPVRVRWDRVTDDFSRTVAAGSWGSTASGFAWQVNSGVASSLSVSGGRGVVQLTPGDAAWLRPADAGSPDVEVAWSASVGTMPTGGAIVTAGLLRYEDTSNYIRAHAEFMPAGTVDVKIVVVSGGVTTTLVNNTTVIPSYSTSTKINAVARAEGPNLMVKTWVDGTPEPAAWSATATDSRNNGVAAGVFVWRIATNAPAVYIDDFSLTNILWSGNVPEWPPRWPDKSGADSVVPVQGAGILRRLQQGSSPLQSPLRRQLSGLSYATGYWPLEDGSSSATAGSGLSGGTPAVLTGDFSFAGDDTLPGAATSLVLSTAGSSAVAGTTTGNTNTTGYAAMVLFRCGNTISSENTLLDIRCLGTAVRWEVFVNATAIGFRGYNSSNTLIADNAALHSGVNLTQWTAVQLETNVSGGTVTVSLIWHQVGAVDYLATTDTYSGTAQRITGVTAKAVVDSTSVGHLWAGDDTLPFVDDTFSKVSNGYIGETASARITRLCSETGTPVIVLSGASEPMGRQSSASLLDLLRECEAADQGVLFERGNSLCYRPRSLRYNPAVAMALDWSAGDLDEAPEPQDDDQRLRNQWTVTRTSGSSATLTDEASVDAVGLYDDATEVNIASDSRLPDFASWLLSLGTVDELRWPRIRINLVAHPELIPQWLACSIGSRITIANPPEQIAGVVIDLIIEGFTQTINVDKWIVELACSPASSWLVGKYDSTSSRYDSRTTTLASQASASATSLSLQFTDYADRWSTSGVPYPITVAGEVMTVTAMTSPVSLTQQATVVRAVNGVAKILPAGSSVRIATPGRYAL